MGQVDPVVARRSRWIVLALGLAACSGEHPDAATAPAEATWREVPAARAAIFQRELEEARAEQNLPGLAMAIAFRDSRELWVSATGLSNLDAQTAWVPSDESRIGSVTKTFTAARVFQLVEEGVLSLDDPLEKWVPRWYHGVTLRQLLGHTSGIVSYNYVGSFDSARPWTPDELVQWAFDHEPTLRFTPGTRWEYSNTNYVLLGLVIEAATGHAYGDELRSRIFGPLGLDDTRLASSGDDDPRLVRSYTGTPPVDNSASADPSFGWAAGAVVSTPRDLATWTVALFGGELLSAESLGSMTTPSSVTTPDQEQYGLGAFIESDGEHTIVGHTGGIAGYASFAYYLDDPPAALIVLSNWEGTDLRAASSYGWAAILGIEYP